MIWASGVNTACGRRAACDTSLALSRDCLENLPCSALLSTTVDLWMVVKGYGSLAVCHYYKVFLLLLLVVVVVVVLLL